MNPQVTVNNLTISKSTNPHDPFVKYDIEAQLEEVDLPGYPVFNALVKAVQDPLVQVSEALDNIQRFYQQQLYRPLNLQRWLKN